MADSQRNRFNLGLITGFNYSSSTHEAHHVLPQKFALKFSDYGINVHDPRFLQWWPTETHKKMARQYNDKWEKFFDTNPNASLNEILAKGKNLMAEYGLTVNY